VGARLQVARLIPKGYLEVSRWCKPPVYAVRRYIEEQAEHHRKRSFAKNTWSCYAGATYNLTNVTFNPTPQLGLDAFVVERTGGLDHRLISKRTLLGLSP